MNAITLIFPHQLFKQHPALDKNIPVCLVEEQLYFNQYRFHRQKLVLHRATMKYYADWLVKKGYTVRYVEAIEATADIRELVRQLAIDGVTHIHAAQVDDDWLQKRLQSSSQIWTIAIHWFPNPGFLNDPKELDKYFDEQKRYYQTAFYIRQRQKRNLLLNKNGTPTGGKWSFDDENRRRWPAGSPAAAIDLPIDKDWLQEARTYVGQHFQHHYGQVDPPHWFAITFEDAEQWLEQFALKRLETFGHYEDAIVADATALHHSLLSPMLNIGLLTPDQVLARCLAIQEGQTPLNSIEGFIRQLIGWREFIRIVYRREGVKQRTMNFWEHKKSIPERFWTGHTGILPVDKTIRKLLRTGYCHHIERLMVLGNFMLLCEFDPDQVYQWFMELFIDAYDWVMVPNVYGMSQFADGGLMTTKPYFSGSNYLLKMGDYAKGPWQYTWDSLFWRFIDKHRGYLVTNQRLAMMVNTFDRMSAEKRLSHLLHAETWLGQLN